MITEQAFYLVVAQSADVEAAFDRVICAMTEAARAAARLGWSAKFQLARSVVEQARAMSQLLTVYGLATGYRHPTSDMDCLGQIASSAATYPGRKFLLRMLAMADISPDELRRAPGEPAAHVTNDADLHIEVVQSQ